MCSRRWLTTTSFTVCRRPRFVTARVDACDTCKHARTGGLVCTQLWWDNASRELWGPGHPGVEDPLQSVPAAFA